ncbi:UNVERIFIED_CONTAM: hypothetical protein FKN15_005180 [Acipenser sinensis]
MNPFVRGDGLYKEPVCRFARNARFWKTLALLPLSPQLCVLVHEGQFTVECRSSPSVFEFALEPLSRVSPAEREGSLESPWRFLFWKHGSQPHKHRRSGLEGALTDSFTTHSLTS